MQSEALNFKKAARGAIADPNLRQALSNLETGFVAARSRAAAGLDEFEAMRDAAVDLKNHILANLDFYLARFEERVVAQGGTRVSNLKLGSSGAVVNFSYRWIDAESGPVVLV